MDQRLSMVKRQDKSIYDPFRMKKRVFKRACFYCCRDVVNQIKQRKLLAYCYKTKWITTRYEDYSCIQCNRIRSHLTLDGVRLKKVGAFVDKNAEERAIRSLYFTRIRRRLNF